MTDPTIPDLAASMRSGSHGSCTAESCDTVKILDALRDEEDYATSLRADLDRANALLAKVREVHRPSDPFGECVACTYEIGEGGPPGSRWDCAHGDRIVPWPCPTIQALNAATKPPSDLERGPDAPTQVGDPP